MNNARIVLNNYGADRAEEVYLVPKEGYVLEQDITTVGGQNILRIYTVSKDAFEVRDAKWYNVKKYKIMELLFTAELSSIKYITYDE